MIFDLLAKLANIHFPNRILGCGSKDFWKNEFFLDLNSKTSDQHSFPGCGCQNFKKIYE